MLAERGHRVTAVDIPQSNYAPFREFPVQDYDGRNLPFEDGTFDIVFSSNVLEHVPHLDELNREIARVLRSGGRAIHVLPSASWQALNLALHIPALARDALRLLTARKAGGAATPKEPCTRAQARLTDRALRRVLPHRHGEHGNALTELYLFSRFHWHLLFRATGFVDVRRYGSRLAYSGYMLVGRHLSLSARSRLSRLVGSSCHVFVMTKP